MKPAGFLPRALASLIDGLLIALAGWICFFVLYGLWLAITSDSFTLKSLFEMKEITSFQTQLIEAGIEFVIYVWYYTFFHFRYRATPGKRALSLEVLTRDGHGLSLKTSFWRSLAYILSYAPFGGGFLMAAFHPRKMTLHDLVCGTEVVKVPRKSEG